MTNLSNEKKKVTTVNLEKKKNLQDVAIGPWLKVNKEYYNDQLNVGQRWSDFKLISSLHLKQLQYPTLLNASQKQTKK